MELLTETYQVKGFSKLNENHVFMCTDEIKEFVSIHRINWLIDLINAFEKSKDFLTNAALVRWDFNLKYGSGWLVADDGTENVLLRRKIPGVPMDDFHIQFLRRRGFLFKIED